MFDRKLSKPLKRLKLLIFLLGSIYLSSLRFSLTFLRLIFNFLSFSFCFIHLSIQKFQLFSKIKFLNKIKNFSCIFQFSKINEVYAANSQGIIPLIRSIKVGLVSL